eukprot:6186543-Pleurochrysis_carterae.AAC.5
MFSLLTRSLKSDHLTIFDTKANGIAPDGRTAGRVPFLGAPCIRTVASAFERPRPTVPRLH